MSLSHFKGSELAAAGHFQRFTFRRGSSDFSASGAALVFRQGAALGPPASIAVPPVREDLLGPGLRLEAPQLTGNQLEQRVEGRQVTLHSPSGLVGYAPQVRADGRTQTVSSPDSVHLEGPGYTLDADRLEASLATGQFAFEGNVRTWLDRRER